METSLHRELKLRYAGRQARTEVVLENYRIDAVSRGRLIEIQHGSLSAIRDKIGRLLARHRVLVVKPIVRTKVLIKQPAPGHDAHSRRLSPKRGGLLDIFDELVYFTRVFPHPRLALEVVLVDIEEWRYPGHGRRRRWRHNDHVVADQKLVGLGRSVRLRRPADLIKLLPARLPAEFHTRALAQLCDVRRDVAQRIAYCLREMQAVERIGKQGNAILYRAAGQKSRRGDEAA
ncbi:MAG: hypothetical protein WDZ48_07815 [Pirellulales bacterium]